MDYLTLDMVKQHLRIDYNDDDERLIKNANLAESLVYKTIDKDYFRLIREYHEIPKDIIMATLLVTELLLRHEDPTQSEVYKMIMRPYKPKEENN